MAEQQLHVHRTQSALELGPSKRRFSTRSAALNARKGFAGALDKILGSSRPVHVGSNQQQVDIVESSVVVGPVIGKVTHNSARVLIEIDRNSLVTAVLEAQKQQESELPQVKRALGSLHSWSWRSLQLKKKHSRNEYSSPAAAAADDKEQVFSLQKELKAGRPGVFHFSNLKPGTRYKVCFKGCRYSILGSFRTLELSASAATQRLSFGVVSCNNVYITQKAIPIHSDLWEQLFKHISAGKVDYLLHLGDQIYADVDPEVGGPQLNRFETAKSILRGLTAQERQQCKGKICELYRQVYRETWQHLPTAKCLASCPNLMILDDHEIRDNWGDIPEDWNRNSDEFFIAHCAWIVYLEYQRQLHEDVDFSSLDLIHKEYHFHVLGGVGLMFVDIRGSRTFHRVEGDESAYLGTEQWKDFSDSLLSPGGIFNGVSALLLCATAPLVFLEPVITNVAAQRVNRLEDFKGHWSAQLHTREQIRMIDLLIAWKSAQEGREVLALGGDVHCGGHSDVFKDNELVFQQLTSSAIANTSLPKSAYYFMRFVGRLGGTLRNRYTFKHYHWTRSRNYGLVQVEIQRLDLKSGAPSSAEITAQLVKGKFMRGIMYGAKVASVKGKGKRKKIIACCL